MKKPLEFKSPENCDNCPCFCDYGIKEDCNNGFHPELVFIEDEKVGFYPRPRACIEEYGL